MNRSATKLQSRWRGSNCRSERSHREATVRIQRHWRGVLTRMQARRLILSAPRLCTPQTISWLGLIGHQLLEEGAEVMAQFGNGGDNAYYHATVVRNNGDGTYHLQYEGGSEWRAAPGGRIKMDVSTFDLKDAVV